MDFGTGMTFADTGLSASAGVSIPTTSENHNPIFTFGISIDPNAFRQAKITSQIEKLEAEQEAISIQSARNNYQTAVTTQAAELADIQWNKSSNTETYNLYKSLAADLQTDRNQKKHTHVPTYLRDIPAGERYSGCGSQQDFGPCRCYYHLRDVCSQHSKL